MSKRDICQKALRVQGDLMLGLDEVYVEPKFDGFRVLVIDGRCYSRTGNLWGGLDPIGELAGNKVPDLVLDGEILHADGTWGSTASLCKTEHPSDDLLDAARIRVFDTLPLSEYRRGGTGRPLELRQVMAYDAVNEIGSVHFANMPCRLASTESAVMRIYRSALRKGLEGVMIKDPHGGYVVGARVASWSKLKNLITVDGVIVGFNEGRAGSKMENMVATMEVMLQCGTVVRASGRMGFKLRQEMWNFPSRFMGRYVELEFQNDKTPVAQKRFRQFIRFRPDLDQALMQTTSPSSTTKSLSIRKLTTPTQRGRSISSVSWRPTKSLRGKVFRRSL